MIKSLSSLIFVIVFCTTISSCKTEVNDSKYSFYHWKTNFNLTEQDKTHIQDGQSNILYMRFFDVDFNTKENKPLPIATVQFSKDFEVVVDTIVPVVFIKNEVFKHITLEESKSLSKPVSQKIKRLFKSYFEPQKMLTKIQIDCDWSQHTKTKYFAFLESLATYFDNIELSTTLRLHQVKYREKTGVPPVDKVVLMAYNVGDILNIDETNSIINNNITSQYLQRLSEYPLPYDVALPVFEWAILYRREKPVAILNNYSLKTFRENFRPTQTLNMYKAHQDCYISSNFIYKDDVVRVETASKNDLKKLSELIKTASKKPYSTIFYHIGSPVLSNFTNHDLKTFCYN